MLLLAGPGSGKTHTLVSRICYLTQVYGVPPDKILTLTFSKEAAYEMRNRYLSRSESKDQSVHFGTFHAVFYHILKKQKLYNDGSILTHKEKTEFIRYAGKRLGIKEAGEETWQEEMLSRITVRKKKYMTGSGSSMPGSADALDACEEAGEESMFFEKLYDIYESRCRSEKKIDFDDMMIECIKLLKAVPKVLKKWQDKYDYILVDEFQDIDNMQYEILKLLAGTKRNLFMVGDDDQSIYGFRGADPSIMLRLKEDFEDLITVNLKLNYRSASSVIETARAVISHNRTRYTKEQFPVSDEKGSVYAEIFPDHIKEAEYVAEHIAKLLEGNKEMTIGILYRTARCADHLESVLRNRGITYERRESDRNFYDQENIKDIIAYFYLTWDPGDRKHLLRILNRPERGLSREAFAYDTEASSFDLLKDYYGDDEDKLKVIEKLHRDIIFIKDLPPQAAVRYILKGIGYEKYMGRHETNILSKPEMASGRQGMADGRELSCAPELSDGGNSLISDGYRCVEEFIALCRNCRSIGSFIFMYEEYLEDLGKKGFVTEKSDHKGIPVMQTVHASKGLEYDAVFIIGLEEGFFPHKKARSESDIEEERRLFYVALTRAKSELYLCGRKLDGFGKRESRFLHETGLVVNQINQGGNQRTVL
ncbi:MAG: ATP-dependent helicase [Lachnospiraceae bacterium]|nr:ATP-dependent helicase [Lachnospiraceae bacterium]